METPIEPPLGGTTTRDFGFTARDGETIFGPGARPVRPVVPMRRADAPAAKNPFTALNEANKEHEELNHRLENLVEKLAGDAPRFGHAPENAPTPTGLLPLSRGVAMLITERSKHGVSLIDRLEELLA